MLLIHIQKQIIQSNKTHKKLIINNPNFLYTLSLNFFLEVKSLPIALKKKKKCIKKQDE